MTDYQILPNFRIRTIPVFGALPAIFGMACAAHVVTHLAGQIFDPEPVLRMQKKQFETQLDRLRDREDARGSQSSSVAVDVEVSLLNPPRLTVPCRIQFYRSPFQAYYVLAQFNRFVYAGHRVPCQRCLACP